MTERHTEREIDRARERPKGQIGRETETQIERHTQRDREPRRER